MPIEEEIWPIDKRAMHAQDMQHVMPLDYAAPPRKVIWMNQPAPDQRRTPAAEGPPNEAEMKRRAIAYVANALEKKADAIDDQLARLKVQMGLERGKRPAMRMLATERQKLLGRYDKAVAAADEVRCLLPTEDEQS
jgi:hypothetical protein